MLANDKIHPKSAFEASGLFIDTEEAYNLGMEWYNKVKSEMAKQETVLTGNARRVKVDEE
jgi:hypothetical protein